MINIYIAQLTSELELQQEKD